MSGAGRNRHEQVPRSRATRSNRAGERRTLARPPRGDVTWEANLVAAHHRLAVTPMYFEDGTGNAEWLTAHGAFHAALAAAAGSPILERLRRQLYDASELYRIWSGNLPHHPTRAHVGREHRAIFDAALARDADLAVDQLTQHLETTARHLEAVAPDVDTEAPAGEASSD